MQPNDPVPDQVAIVLSRVTATISGALLVALLVAGQTSTPETVTAIGLTGICLLSLALIICLLLIASRDEGVPADGRDGAQVRQIISVRHDEDA